MQINGNQLVLETVSDVIWHFTSTVTNVFVLSGQFWFSLFLDFL